MQRGRTYFDRRKFAFGPFRLSARFRSDDKGALTDRLRIKIPAGGAGGKRRQKLNEKAMKTTHFSELELSDERFDRKPGPIRDKILVCATGRTGSWLLCRVMINNGIGLPHEYFNARHIGLIGPRCGIPALADGRTLRSDGKARRSYFDALLQRRTVNGVFAAKMHWDQYADYLDNPEGDDLLQNGNFIHLYREDLLAQAVSIHISRQTGRWELDPSVTTPPAEKPNYFDVDMIDNQMSSLAELEANWQLFFARNGIRPLRFSYEQLTGDLPGALRTIVDRFGLDAPAGDLDHFEEGSGEARRRQCAGAIRNYSSFSEGKATRHASANRRAKTRR